MKWYLMVILICICWASFQVLVGHMSIFFGEMSVQVHSAFLKGVFVSLLFPPVFLDPLYYRGSGCPLPDTGGTFSVWWEARKAPSTVHALEDNRQLRGQWPLVNVWKQAGGAISALSHSPGYPFVKNIWSKEIIAQYTLFSPEKKWIQIIIGHKE